jgi:hypothetical protein
VEGRVRKKEKGKSKKEKTFGIRSSGCSAVSQFEVNSNIERPTLNAEWPVLHSMLDVGRSMFDVKIPNQKSSTMGE